MSYLVIARKYRPQRFPDVVGQEHVTQTLANAIRQNRIAHAYLFCGPRGTGKTTIARIFAKCLNCTDGPKVDFDDKDPRCQEITEGRSLDVLEIDGASNNGVEQVRELRDTVKYSPASSKFKIYIIDEVHMLSTAAFNALLKTLEEPPAHAKFMFATTEPEKVLPTILSRCQRFDLRRIPSALIVKHLAHIAELEKVKIDEPALYAIARGADGGMRDAESTLDQLISFCGEKIQEEDVLSMFGLTAQGQILEMAHAILAGEIQRALRNLNELARHGKDLGRLLSDLLGHFRNLLLFRISRGDLQLLEVSEAEAASLAKQSEAVSPESLTRIMEVLTDCEVRLRDVASPRILIEVALLQAVEARSAMSIDSVLEQLRGLRIPSGKPVESRMTSESQTIKSESTVPAPRTPEITSAAPRSSEAMTPATEASAAVDNNLEQLWAKVIESVGRASPFIRGYLLEARPVSFHSNLLTIGFDPEFADHLDLVDNTKNRTIIQTKLRELGYGDAQVAFVKAEAPIKRPAVNSSPAPAAPVSQPAERTEAAPTPERAAATIPLARKPKPESSRVTDSDFKNDPLIQKALEVFRGQIVEIRA